MKTKYKYLIPVICLIGSMTACVDNDDVVVNYYASTKVTAAGYLEENTEVFSDFIDILKRTPYYSLLSTYGEFTLFAPTNDAIGTYVEANGFGSVDAIPTTTAIHWHVHTSLRKVLSLRLISVKVPCLS